MGENGILFSLQINCSCINPTCILFNRITDENKCSHSHLLILWLKMKQWLDPIQITSNSQTYDISLDTLSVNNLKIHELHSIK